MPCRDVDEILTLTLDRSDRLVDYRLSKRTCGAIVGSERLLLDWLSGASVTEIVALSSVDLDARYRAEDDERAFLYFKHLFALRDGIACVIGSEDALAVTLESIEVAAEDGSLVARAIVEVELMAERIRSCGGCGTCRPRRLPIVNE